MKNKMDSVRGKYAPISDGMTVDERLPSEDDVPVEYRDHPSVVALWRHLKQFGRACGILLLGPQCGDQSDGEFSLVFSPPLKPPGTDGDDNRWWVGVEAVRMLRAARKDLRLLLKNHNEPRNTRNTRKTQRTQ